MSDRTGSPRTSFNADRRITIELSEQDWRTYIQRGSDAVGYRGDVTDLRTGKRLHVYGASCSLPTCYCDAVVRPAKEKIVDRGW